MNLNLAKIFLGLITILIFNPSFAQDRGDPGINTVTETWDDPTFEQFTDMSHRLVYWNATNPSTVLNTKGLFNCSLYGSQILDSDCIKEAQNKLQQNLTDTCISSEKGRAVIYYGNATIVNVKFNNSQIKPIKVARINLAANCVK